MTRDNIIWSIGLLAGILGFISGHFGAFPFIAPEYQSTIELAASVLALISAKFGMSPLPVSPAKGAELAADANDAANPVTGAPPKFDFWKLLGR